MNVYSTKNRIIIFISLLSFVFDRLEEGNIYIPMYSNFTLKHINNKAHNRNYYTIPLKVGTPPEEFNVQIDTSTATTWLPSSNCENCILSTKLYKEQYSSTSSPTNKEIELEDEDGDLKGYEVSDNFILGSYKLKQFNFVQATKLDDEFRDYFDGKLGLGYKSTDDDFNFLERLKKSNLIVKKIFSINTINDKKGMSLIGDIPGKQYHTFCNVSTDTEELDDMYKESWVCHLTHVGSFKISKGIPNKINSYHELDNSDLVNFDTAYDYIGVPISEKENIEKLIKKANLKCETRENNAKEKMPQDIKLQKLKNRIRDEEVSILCETNIEEIRMKAIALSFVLQGYVYSLPLDLLFINSHENGKMEMLIRYIDDDDAIWTFGYPFMNQFLTIFNMEDGHVGLKKLKKTALPIVNLYKDWEHWYLRKEGLESAGKIVGIIVLILVVIVLAFLVYRYIRRRTLEKNGPAIDTGNNEDNDNDNKNRVY